MVMVGLGDLDVAVRGISVLGKVEDGGTSDEIGVFHTFLLGSKALAGILDQS